MKIWRITISALLGAVLLSACCRDCDSTVLSPTYDYYFTGFKAGSEWDFVDTLHQDTDKVFLSSLDRAVRVKKKKQFPIDCEECGIETSVLQYKGFSMNDTSQKNYVYQAVLNALDNSLTISNQSGDPMFSYANIRFQNLDSMVVHGTVYHDVLALSTTPCSADSSLAYCHKTYPYFSKLYFARNDGLIRWEAKNHPLYGDAVFELYRHVLKH